MGEKDILTWQQAVRWCCKDSTLWKSRDLRKDMWNSSHTCSWTLEYSGHSSQNIHVAGSVDRKRMEKIGLRWFPIQMGVSKRVVPRNHPKLDNFNWNVRLNRDLQFKKHSFCAFPVRIWFFFPCTAWGRFVSVRERNRRLEGLEIPVAWWFGWGYPHSWMFFWGKIHYLKSGWWFGTWLKYVPQ